MNLKPKIKTFELNFSTKAIWWLKKPSQPKYKQWHQSRTDKQGQYRNEKRQKSNRKQVQVDKKKKKT